MQISNSIDVHVCTCTEFCDIDISGAVSKI
jgi:hypothetical protein